MHRMHHVHVPESMQHAAARPDGSGPHNLEEVLIRLCTAGGEQGEVSLGELLDSVGRRSFGPLLLVCGIIVFWPITIPGLPSIMAVLVLLIAVQLLLRRNYFWLPHWLLRRKMKEQKLRKVVRFLLPAARVADRVVHQRLPRFTGAVCARVVAVVCMCLALIIPPLELLPFSSSTVGAALTLFGLALIAQDGLMVLLGLAFCAVAFGLALTLL